MPKSIKDKVKDLEDQNRLLTDNLVDAVWVMDAKSLMYEYITPSIYQISGYHADELVGTSIIDRLAPESLNRATEMLHQESKHFNAGKNVTRSLELELIHKSGRSYWVEIRAKFIQDPGSELKIVGITRDITAKKIAELQIKEINRKLAETLADKEKLLEEIKVLQELLPICSGCKRIRDDNDKWWPIEAYVRKHTGTDFTHTMCPDCKDVFYQDLKK